MLAFLLTLTVLQSEGATDSLSATLRDVDRLLARGESSKALSRARAIVAAYPHSAEAHAVAGDAAGAEAGRAGFPRLIGLAQECQRLYRRAVELDSSNVRALEGMIGYLAQAPKLFGGNIGAAERLTFALERVDAARGMIARALVILRRRANGPISDSLVAKALSQQRNDAVLERAASYYTARSEHQRALELQLDRSAMDTTSAVIWFEVARSRLAVGDTVSALVELERSWRLARHAGDSAWIAPERIAWRLTDIASKQHRNEDAGRWADSTLAVRPDHANARRVRDSLRRRRSD